MPVERIHDPIDKKIIAFCDWVVVDEEGTVDDLGEYVFIRELWIHEKWRNKGVVRKMIDMVSVKVPSAVEVYWQRMKYKNRLKQFPRWKMLRLKKKEK